MSSPPPLPPGAAWLWDKTRECWYYYDPVTDEVVYQSGRRFPRPGTISSRTFLDMMRRAQASGQRPPSHPASIPESSNQQSSSIGDLSRNYAAREYVSQPPPASAVKRTGGPLSTGSTDVDADLNSRIQDLHVQRQQPRPAPNASWAVAPPARTYAVEKDEVHSIVQKGPAEKITPPELLQQGIELRGRVYGTEDSDRDSRFPEYRVMKYPREFFKFGRVFAVLWSEPSGDATHTNTTYITSQEIAPNLLTGKDGDLVYQKFRRFIVVRESNRYCIAIPINSYGRQGVGKDGEVKSDHGIVYIGKVAPSPDPSERPRPGEAPMRSIAIRIDPAKPSEKLLDMSRINYAKVYTVEHNVKVRDIGRVNNNSILALKSQFEAVWSSRTTNQVSREVMINGLIGEGYTRKEALEILQAKQQARSAPTTHDRPKGKKKVEETHGADDEDSLDEAEVSESSQNLGAAAAMARERPWQQRNIEQGREQDDEESLHEAEIPGPSSRPDQSRTPRSLTLNLPNPDERAIRNLARDGEPRKQARKLLRKK